MGSPNIFHNLSNLPEEDQVLVTRFGRGPSLSVPHPTVHAAFESIVDSQPLVIAARFQGKETRYGELDADANRLANYLIELGLPPRQRVCLVVQRSLEMLVGILAVLKAGCQYVPVDGGVCTDQGLSHILKDTQAPVVLCLPKFEENTKRQTSPNVKVIALGMGEEKFCSHERPRISVSSKEGAYAIYTSGSTGKPKGVNVTHGNVTNALLLEPGRLGISKGSKVAQVLSIAFDMGAWEILACLMNGGTLYLRGASWEETLSEVDTIITTPSILSKYRRNSFPNIKTVVTGGEPCPQSLADEWARGTAYFNICGPQNPGTALSIGTPLPNTNVYVLDETENPVPFGSKGIMWVGGAGVTRGYINLPDLTSDRYKLDKFTQDGSMMFNTGDLVQWRQDGSLNTLGRIDEQVKVKGFRVELDGVSAVIEDYPGITRACAALIDGTLHGFYTTMTFIDEDDLGKFVGRSLPYYSVPEHWNYLPAIPLTPNGKVNKEMLVRIAFRKTRAPPRRTSTFTDKDLYHAAAAEKEAGSVQASRPVSHSRELSDFDFSRTNSIEEAPVVTLPAKNGFHGERWLRHHVFILYRKFFTVVVLANLAVASVILYRRVKIERPMLADIATATATNLTMCVLMRSEPVINVLFTTFCSVPTWVPLGIRRHCARIFHIGGLHSGCGIAAGMWFLVFTVGASYDFTLPPRYRCITLVSTVLTYVIALLIVAIISMSHPAIRARHHDLWECSHRYGGWSLLVLFWCHAVLVTRDLRLSGSPMQSYRTSPPIWLLAISTTAVIYPWLSLRKVPVRSEVLSDHAIRLHFEYTTPVVGTSVRIAERPLIDWHGFATITNSNGKGFSLVVSNAGDFTKRTIQRAPTHIWVKGQPACGVLRIATLFKSIVLVATGSGIGPCLAVILAKKIPCRILWTAPNPEQTFGKEIIESVMDMDPKAVIHNTRTMGKPDMGLMTYQLYKESGAEAVCVISNKKFTSRIVYQMESRGIPAYGAIFDS
ncbi:hypothetical protein BCR34DRAFT_622471 [Clohesyomyces aquaticus]|uniref:AMP-dependent synthetase/ligase domain-containing protein n=1 Tax=Clohesyomyces aquaticus TaxID=1231657 RepID=A0A1Y2A197_9PLEO|nr:hypothetical protein BCR34DRAFT_622471 [Clohesyomyces aquaticus]